MALYLGSNGKLCLNLCKVSGVVDGYLYNGVQLPDIESVWDKEKYPYAFIVYHDAYNDIYDRYELWISADEPYMREYSGLHQLMVAGAEGYFLTDSVWTLEYTFEDDWQAIESQYEGDTCIWSNVDILDLDGSILSAASEPIPVYTNKCISYTVDNSRLMVNDILDNTFPIEWNTLSVRKNKIRSVAVEPAIPIAYSYNGVVLPDINTVWTGEIKAKYPYITICRPTSAYEAFFTNNPLKCEVSTGVYLKFDEEVTGTSFVCDVLFDPNTHLEVGIGDKWTELYPGVPYEQYLGKVENNPYLWANYDVDTLDGSIYYAASEPIPVYE